ncbi:energy-coupling factor ABC transporter ATP-binding protein [Thermohalobacter berrensis]|uniref:ABC transporter ATP-binding protein n=1 Tax=Thermohalobacter berrensis TaxID=99594 RepID=A0A419SZL5_9FIRM|nr:ATP-binding cassette domain-containing protein [Thermohalobacter berrensis]RKD30619.1 ABC transporter ATP-binding protein [Thermohalobacter berrensis]
MLKTVNLTYKYEDKTVALKDVNVDLKKGEIIGIVGPNGSGKTTLFLNFVGILIPTKGEVLFNGQKVKYRKKYLIELRRKVGIVFQDPEKQIFYSRVYDDVAFALRNLGLEEKEVEKRVYNALKTVKALDLENKPVHFLSYGQKKRVAIASVLALDTEVIFLDEPTAGLDPYMVDIIVDIIKEIKRKGKRVVISSHNMDLIYSICDYIYVLNNGIVLGEGRTKEIFLQDEILKGANLKQPWLVRLHKNLGIPLYKSEEELYANWNKIKL